MKPLAVAPVLAVLLSAHAAFGAEVPVTYGDAMRWYTSAAEAGSADAQFFLGRMFETGANREVDPVAALGWYRKAAEQGHRLAQYQMGLMYQHANGVERDLAVAREFYAKAAAQHLPEAQFNLGYLYDRGLGTERNAGLAAQWYLKAAERGLVPAQFNLGVVLAGDAGKGGMAADLVQSWVWLSIAAAGGRADAAAIRDEVEARMSEAEIARARAAFQARRKR